MCGEDGITYQGACIAACQGVKVAKQKPCSPKDARQYDTKAPLAEGPPAGAAAAMAVAAGLPGLAAGRVTAVDINR